MWRVAMAFAESIYGVTKHFPREEQFGLTAQLRRAAVAIPSNVSEEHQHGTKAYAHFVTMALGSLAEAETQLELARRLGLVSELQIASMTNTAATLGRLLHGLRKSLHGKT